MRAFDRPVLVRDAAIVAGRLHAVMRAQCLVAARLILPGVGVEVANAADRLSLRCCKRGTAERP